MFKFRTRLPIVVLAWTLLPALASAALVLVLAFSARPAEAAPFAYVTNYNFAGTVSVIDTATNTVVATVDVGSFPLSVAVTPNGQRAYVTNQSSKSVSVIDAATNAVVATVPVGLGPQGVRSPPTGNLPMWRMVVLRVFRPTLSPSSTRPPIASWPR
jgi:YVTN family beta-propeller protein